MTVDRFIRPTQLRWGDVTSLSIGIVAHAGKVDYAVIGSHEYFHHRVLEASPHQPALLLVLEIDPWLVRSVASSMPNIRQVARTPRGVGEECPVSPLDDDMTDTVVRFLASLPASSDRQVLAPLHLRELVYRVLQREQRARLLHHAAHQAMANPVAPALEYISTHLAEPLTVDVLAAQVCLSASAFSRAFREMTGRPPYQYVKEMRLHRARQLLEAGRHGVADVSRSVGYTSVSHFIKEFRSRFGSTPGDYSDAPMFPGTVAAFPSSLV